MTTLAGGTVRDHGDLLRAGRRAGLVPTSDKPASCRVVRHNGPMEPDTAARVYGYESSADWYEAVTAEMRWGVFDPARLHQLTDLFAEEPEPITPEGAALVRALAAAAPPDGDLDPLYAGGWVDDDGHLTAEATRLWFDSLAAAERASR